MPDRPKKKAGIVSKTLGYCIIVGAAGAKAPQILQIIRAGNAAGLSLLMPVFEVLGCASALTACSAAGPCTPPNADPVAHTPVGAQQRPAVRRDPNELLPAA